MRVYDIDLTIHIRCSAHNENEALEVVLDRFEEGEYNDTSAKWFEVTKIKEVEYRLEKQSPKDIEKGENE